jgi:hypothetical protein
MSLISFIVFTSFSLYSNFRSCINLSFMIPYISLSWCLKNLSIRLKFSFFSSWKAYSPVFLKSDSSRIKSSLSCLSLSSGHLDNSQPYLQNMSHSAFRTICLTEDFRRSAVRMFSSDWRASSCCLMISYVYLSR